MSIHKWLRKQIYIHTNGQRFSLNQWALSQVEGIKREKEEKKTEKVLPEYYYCDFNLYNLSMFSNYLFLCFYSEHTLFRIRVGKKMYREEMENTLPDKYSLDCWL